MSTETGGQANGQTVVAWEVPAAKSERMHHMWPKYSHTTTLSLSARVLIFVRYYLFSLCGLPLPVRDFFAHSCIFCSLCSVLLCIFFALSTFLRFFCNVFLSAATWGCKRTQVDAERRGQPSVSQNQHVMSTEL